MPRSSRVARGRGRRGASAPAPAAPADGIAASRRRRATGYGSALLARASVCARALRYGGDSRPAGLALGVLTLPYLLGLLLLAPRARVRVSERPCGRRIRAHLGLRRWGLPRFRLAQGVLHIPEDQASYLRGRSRQAVRTNVARARAGGVRCAHAVRHWPVSGSCPGQEAPVECWQAWNRAGALVGEAWVTIDSECALLHSLNASETDVRWLMHTAIVEELCARGCRQLLTNSHDAFLMAPGQQYFQRLLGYSVERIRLRRSRPLPAAGRASRAIALVVLLASATAVGEQALTSIL